MIGKTIELISMQIFLIDSGVSSLFSLSRHYLDIIQHYVNNMWLTTEEKKEEKKKNKFDLFLRIIAETLRRMLTSHELSAFNFTILSRDFYLIYLISFISSTVALHLIT